MNLAVISNRTTWAAKLEKLLTWCVWPERAVKMQHHRLQKAIVSQTCPAGAKITPNLHCHSSEGHYCVKDPKKRSTKYEIKSLGHFHQIFSITFLWFGYENNRCIASLSLCMYLTVLTVINSHLGCDEQDVVLNPPPATSLFISTSDVTVRSTRNSNLSRTLLTIWRSIHSQLKACQSILFTALLAFYIWYWNRSHILATGNLDHVSLLVTSALQSSSPHVHAGSPVFYLFNQIFCLHRGLV